MNRFLSEFGGHWGWFPIYFKDWKKVTKDTKNKAFTEVLQKKFKLREQHKRHADGTPTSEAAEEIIARIENTEAELRASQTPESQGLSRSIYIREVHGEQRDDNFTAEVQWSEPVFFRNDAAREFFSLMDESDRPLYQGQFGKGRSRRRNPQRF
ncbi:hypothetical protein K1719_017510 [Acacia pycnantha]|nr:hypothetical protein K1719_017510 [Acacia pycnantha]